MITTLVDYLTNPNPILLYGDGEPATQDTVDATDGTFYLDSTGPVWKKTGAIWGTVPSYSHYNGLILNQQFENNTLNLVIESFPMVQANKPLKDLRNPTYLLINALSSANVAEGTDIQVLVKTTFVQNGTDLYYTVSGANIDATDTALVGVVTINNNVGTIVHNINADMTTEGNEDLRITLATGESIDFVILDTSVTPTVSYITAPARNSYSPVDVTISGADPSIYTRIIDNGNEIASGYPDGTGALTLSPYLYFGVDPRSFIVDFGYGQLQLPLTITPAP